MNFHIKLISKETISELFFASLFLMSKLEREIERKIDRERDIISAFSYADENVEHERDFTLFVYSSFGLATILHAIVPTRSRYFRTIHLPQVM